MASIAKAFVAAFLAVVGYALAHFWHRGFLLLFALSLGWALYASWQAQRDLTERNHVENRDAGAG